MSRTETWKFWDNSGKVEEQQEMIKLSFNEEGALVACEIRDTSDIRWNGAFSEKFRVHELVSAYLTEQRLLLDSQHIKLGNPQTTNSITRFEIELRDGKRPVNLSFLYPSAEKKTVTMP